MPATRNSSSSPDAEAGLVRIPLARLRPHPANPNVMFAEQRATLQRHIAETGRYPPLIVRPHPCEMGAYQTLDGHKRGEVLAALGSVEALCYVWPCDDQTALLLLATLNRLRGEDMPAKRAALIVDLAELLPPEELAQLLPEDPTAIEDAIRFVDLDADRLLAELTAAAEREAAQGPRVITFAVDRDDETVIEAAIDRALASLTGSNRRGRALATICRASLEGCDG